MKSQMYLQLLASQLLVGASSASLFAWSHEENAPVLPRQTNAVKKHLDGRSPAPQPTSPPVAYRQPRKDGRVLKRAVETCGFRNGNKNLPLECGEGLYCFNDPNISMIDCCSSADVEDCTAAVTCLDSTQSRLWTGGNTWLCDDKEFPSCVTLRYGPGSYSGYTWIACGRTADDFGTAYYETTALVITDTSSEEPITPPSPRTTIVTPKPDDPDPDTDTTSPSTSTPTSPPIITTTAAAASSSVPIGPIVGGAVGGVAVLALIGVGIFFLVFKKRRQDNVQPQQIQPQPAVSQIPPAQTPTPGPGPGPSSPSSPVSGIAAAAIPNQDFKGSYYGNQPNLPVAASSNMNINPGSPPMSPAPAYSSSPPPNPMQQQQAYGVGVISPMTMSAVTSPSPGSQYGGASPQMGLGVMPGQQQYQQQPQQQYYGQQQQQPQIQQQNQGYFYQQGQQGQQGPQGHVAELDTVRGDGEVRELP